MLCRYTCNRCFFIPPPTNENILLQTVFDLLNIKGNNKHFFRRFEYCSFQTYFCHGRHLISSLVWTKNARPRWRERRRGQTHGTLKNFQNGGNVSVINQRLAVHRRSDKRSLVIVLGHLRGVNEHEVYKLTCGRRERRNRIRSVTLANSFWVFRRIPRRVDVSSEVCRDFRRCALNTRSPNVCARRSVVDYNHMHCTRSNWNRVRTGEQTVSMRRHFGATSKDVTRTFYDVYVRVHAARVIDKVQLFEVKRLKPEELWKRNKIKKYNESLFFFFLNNIIVIRSARSHAFEYLLGIQVDTHERINFNRSQNTKLGGSLRTVQRTYSWFFFVNLYRTSYTVFRKTSMSLK